ncbi:SMI1/KNR4 family protein [Marinobacter daepoensis]|uniref:SMI1/KNR4 family protein n=1 Tax=Marinobacter daepoensis TaxID=262077 RepID=A0ABS3BGI6_9GAMM|nr:SMI1/KNR4 family protein [Marinobacter daepoensis]MBN7769812.1 SMI1/KNR4 family protein [Marinobacter daepoensis]MBY6078502.1 SMI1/KNR4 family protein [Marinobacter daepoensis]
MEYSEVIENWKLFSVGVKEIGGEVHTLSIEEPATEDEVATVESKLGFEIPRSLKEVLLVFSKKVEFRWFLPDNYKMEGELSQIFSGDRHWSLEWLVKFNENKNELRDEIFPNKNDPYDLVWHDKLAFHEVGNGDYLAIDLSRAGQEPVVYLSHDFGDGHGVEMAKNFKEFVFLSSRLGCVGAEDWQWLPFLVEGVPFINPDSENAIRFREALRVKV